jgi:hypothetical protein
MISITKDQKGEIPNVVLVVAFNPANGEVHGTFAHASYGREDVEGVARSRERFLRELRSDLGTKAKIEVIELPADKAPRGLIKHVDLKTRSLVTESFKRDTIPGIRMRKGRATRKPASGKRPRKK